MGKLKRHLMKDFMREVPRREGEEERDRGLMEDDTGRRVVECIAALRGEKGAIRASDNLELDLRLDSLQRIELIVALENAFSVKLPESFESEVQTVGDLVAWIKEMGGSPSVKREVPRGEGLFTGEPSEEEKRKIGLYQSGVEWSLVLTLLKVLRNLFKILFDLKVKGVENLPDPPFIIAPNHVSNLDGFVVAVALPPEIFRMLHFQGYQPYFRPWPLSRFAQMVHVIPIAPETDWLKAFALSSYVLRRKRALCIFPEGERSWDGDLKEFKKGIGSLAKAHGVPVVPAWIDGTFQILPRSRWWPRPGKIRVAFGKPLRFDRVEFDGKPSEVEEAQLVADQVRERVRQLQELERKGSGSY
jgi:long-chain acyl-CoA synthetase